MPGMDNTGPQGTGPIGRGLGPCGGGRAGWRMGRGFGAGRGFLPNTFTSEEEKTLLENEKNFLESQLEALKKRLQELE